MAFRRIPGFLGKVYVPGSNKNSQSCKKHECKDCFSCQMCDDERCKLCLNEKWSKK